MPAGGVGAEWIWTPGVDMDPPYPSSRMRNGITQLQQVMRGGREKLHRVVLGPLRTDAERLMISYGGHEGIVEAVAKGQGAQAVARVREHLEYGKHFLEAR